MVKKKKSVDRNPWFRVRRKGASWGWLPINWKGWVALLILVGFNVFSAQYFNLNLLILDNWLKFGGVFLLSLFVFIMIAKVKSKV